MKDFIYYTDYVQRVKGNPNTLRNWLGNLSRDRKMLKKKKKELNENS